MSWAEETKLRLQVFALGMLLVCPVGLYWLVPDLLRQLASNQWPQTEGQVKELIAKPWWDEKAKINKYYGRVVYSYTVDGKQYTSDLTELGPGTKRVDRQTALMDVEEYHPGQRLAVYYDPDNPQQAVIEKGASTVHLVLLVVLSVGAVASAISSFFTIRGWWRDWTLSRRQKHDDAATASRSRRAEQVPQRYDIERPRLIAELGEVEETYRPGIANLAAGTVIGLGLIVGGLMLACWLLFRQDPIPLGDGDRIAKYGLILAIGSLAPLAGIALVTWMKRLFSHRVLWAENGLGYVYRGFIEICAWDHIDEIREVLTHESLKVLKIPGASIKNIDRTLIVKRDDGKEFSFTVNSVKRLNRLAQRLKSLSIDRKIPWQIVEQ
jgi:hypothetical protein